MEPPRYLYVLLFLLFFVLSSSLFHSLYVNMFTMMCWLANRYCVVGKCVLVSTVYIYCQSWFISVFVSCWCRVLHTVHQNESVDLCGQRGHTLYIKMSQWFCVGKVYYTLYMKMSQWFCVGKVYYTLYIKMSQGICVGKEDTHCT